MTATNHTLTGVILAVTFPSPLVLPLAFLVHFVLDALPHFDFLAKSNSKKILSLILLIDISIAASILLAILVLQPTNWPLLIASGVACASPDLMWLPNYLRYLIGKPIKPNNMLLKFHKKIQWCERPWGFYVELLWAGVIIYSLIRIL